MEVWDQVGPLILASINYAIDHGRFHRDQNTSLITLLLKKDKHPYCPKTYRPISLISSELKLFAEVLVKRTEPLIGKLINEDQTGFIKGRQASDNVRRLFHVLTILETCHNPVALFSLDAEKTFDRLEWRYLWVVLNVFGFDSNFKRMIKTLYSCKQWFRQDRLSLILFLSIEGLVKAVLYPQFYLLFLLNL